MKCAIALTLLLMGRQLNDAAAPIPAPPIAQSSTASHATEQWIPSQYWGTWAVSNCGDAPADVARNLVIGEVGFAKGAVKYKVTGVLGSGSDIMVSARLANNIAADVEPFKMRVIDGGVRLVLNDATDKPYFKCVKMGG